MKDNKTQRAESVIKEFERLSSQRSNFESHWQEIAERVLPSSKDLFTNSLNGMTKGNKKNELVFDSTASVALNRFGAILDSLLTPRNQMWHKLAPNDPVLARNREVQLYLDEVNETLFRYRYAARANFASQNQQTYKSLGGFGTGSMFIDDLYGEPGIRYRNNHLGEIFIDENHQGQVDKVLRFFTMTARQVLQKWPDSAPTTIKEAVKTSPEKEFQIIHCVKPRTEGYDPTRKDYKGMKYESVYVSVTDKVELSEGGYEVFPYAISRYEQAANEVYGRSPAMDVLPAIKTLNEQKKTHLKLGHRTADPVLLVHDDGIIGNFSLKPGAMNPGGVDAQGRPLVQPLPVGNFSVSKEMMEEERMLINDAFLVTLFQILVETPQMSATEVLERTREKGILLAPTIGRVQSEYLGTMIEREIDVLSRQGLLPQMPEALLEAGGQFKIDYDSPLSRAQRAEEAAGTMRAIENALSIVNVTQNMDPLDHFNWDVVIPDMAAIQGVPAKYMRAFDQIQQMREGRAQAQQEQVAIQAAPAAAAMMKVANQA